MMHSAPYRLILMAIEMACEAGAFLLFVIDLMSCITVAKQPWYGQLNINLSYTIVLHYVLM